MLNMRNCYKRQEIHSKLTKILEAEKPVTCWQFDGNDRNTYTGKLDKFDDETLTIRLESTVSSSGKALDSDSTLFCHCEEESFLFKRDAFGIQGTVIKVKTPTEVKMEERRSMRRFVYKYQDHKLAVLKVPSVNPETGENDHVSISGPLVDINIKGFAFVLDSTAPVKLNVGDKIFVDSLTDQELDEWHHVTIRSIVKYDHNEVGVRGSLVRFGVTFDELMDTVNYKSVYEIVTKKQTRVEGLDIEGFNGLEIDEQERILSTLHYTDRKMESAIRENLDYLERLKFLTGTMKAEIFQEIEMPLLASALRLCTKEVIYELVFDITENLREDFLLYLADPKPLSAVKKAQDMVLYVMRRKEGLGTLVLDPDGYKKFV